MALLRIAGGRRPSHGSTLSRVPGGACPGAPTSAARMTPAPGTNSSRAPQQHIGWWLVGHGGEEQDAKWWRRTGQPSPKARVAGVVREQWSYTPGTGDLGPKEGHVCLW
jgi:hypothetical protein